VSLPGFTVTHHASGVPSASLTLTPTLAGRGVRAQLRRARVQRQRQLLQRLAHRPARRARAGRRRAARSGGACRAAPILSDTILATRPLRRAWQQGKRRHRGVSRCAGLSAAVRLVAQRVRRVRRMRSCARDGWAARGASAAPPGAARGRPHERRPAGRASAGLTSVGRPVRHMGAGALNPPGAGARRARAAPAGRCAGRAGWSWSACTC